MKHKLILAFGALSLFFVGGLLVNPTTAAADPTPSDVSDTPYLSVDPTGSGDCLLHTTSTGGACGTPDTLCCDGSVTPSCTEPTAGMTCIRSTHRQYPIELDVCVAPDGATAMLPGGGSPSGGCPSGQTEVWSTLHQTWVCMLAVEPPGGFGGDGDGDGAGGGGCPG